jgi:NADH-quinone oxidoreductase subunit L
MASAMGVLALLATVAGVLQIPKVTEVVHDFLEPTFGTAPYFHEPLKMPMLLFGMALGTVLGLLGIFVAWQIWVKKPGTSAAIQARLAPLHKLFSNKWYFDEAIDLVIVRPFAAFGRFGQQTIERFAIDGGTTAAPVSLARVSSAAVRSWQSGMLRGYAAAVVFGAGLVLLYLLLQG